MKAICPVKPPFRPATCGRVLTVTERAKKPRKTLINSIRRHLRGPHNIYNVRELTDLIDTAMEGAW